VSLSTLNTTKSFRASRSDARSAGCSSLYARATTISAVGARSGRS
jgi:hypothetical protein